ncbi:MAG: DUF2207 domain-containing protein [Xanthomonadaceae bacterium]|nr:DUF2207 domain-containing protein [Xanthomonadaceae bacterium]
MRRLVGWLAIPALLWAGLALAEERILDYRSDIAIRPDGALDVVETITVRAEGRSIRRGIYRDFPTRYRDRLGNRVVVGFELLGVERNGRPEPHFTERRGNGVRINTGNDDLLPTPGEFTYTLRYRTTRQLGFFDGFDELYWNVTGTGWALTIDSVGATVALPQAVPPDQLRLDGYTGVQGASGSDYRVEVRDAGARVEFQTTRPLAAREGLTLVVGFPKGLVAAPTSGERAASFLHDNRGVLIALIGLALLLAFYVLRWRRYGVDPQPGAIFARYQPPEGHSPAGIRYLRKMAYDERCFAADVVDMAVRGYLTIERLDQDGSERWLLRRRPDGDLARLTAAQQMLAGRLFDGAQTITLTDQQATRVRMSRARHMKALSKRYHPRYFLANGGTIAIGVLLWLVSGGVAFAVAQGDGLVAMIVVLGAGFVAHIVFGWLMKAPTEEGRRLLDEIEGLRLYLSVAERDELARLPAPSAAGRDGSGAEPPLDAERYQALLPYALALDVEDAWTGVFTAAVGAAAATATAASITWYRGGGSLNSLGQLSSALGSSLSQQIASAATPPGSSSGGGGGGFSGGGGGGGGGGGR